jgi:phosphate transport system permease protein
MRNFFKKFIRSRREVRRSDLLFFNSLRLVVFFVFILFLGLFYFLIKNSIPTFQKFGLSFFYRSVWNPPGEDYGALAFIYGTIVSSIIALIIAVPVSISAAIFLTELCPRSLRNTIRFLIELLAAIPSVVYGLWGIFVLAPFIKNNIQPTLLKTGLSLFQGPPFGIGLFSAGLVLAIMIIPTITSVAIEVIRAVPKLYREGAKALGATDWEAIRIAVLQPAKSGIMAAVMLGLGRAMGETMAVTMLIGNRADISTSLFSPAATMSSVIANEYSDASSNLHISSLTAIGLTLLLTALAVFSVAYWIVERLVPKK